MENSDACHHNYFTCMWYDEMLAKTVHCIAAFANTIT